MKTNKSIPMTKFILLPSMNYCRCFGEVECGWNFILCGSGSEQKNCIFLTRSWEYFLKRKLLSRLLDSIRSKGEMSGGNRDMLSGATKSLISLPLTEIHPDIFENVFLQWVHNAHSKIDKISYSVQLIFRIYFKGWVEIFASGLPWI